jgi:hypothetical protein
MTRWMRKQRGLRSLSKIVLNDWHANAEKLLKLPVVAFDVLQSIQQQQYQLQDNANQSKKSSGRLWAYFAGVLSVIVIGLIFFR